MKATLILYTTLLLAFPLGAQETEPSPADSTTSSTVSLYRDPHRARVLGSLIPGAHLRRRVCSRLPHIRGDGWSYWNGNDRLHPGQMHLHFPERHAVQVRPGMASPSGRRSARGTRRLDVGLQCARRFTRCRTRERPSPDALTDRYSNHRAVFRPGECVEGWGVRSLVASRRSFHHTGCLMRVVFALPILTFAIRQSGQ